MDFFELQKTCQEKQNTVSRLNDELCWKIISSDMNRLIQVTPGIEKVDASCYQMGKIALTLRGNVLDIMDGRGELFGWGFEIEHTAEIRLGDAFHLAGKTESVSFLHGPYTVDLLAAVEQVIEEYNAAILFLSGQIDITTHEYRYYSCHEDIYCNDIFGVLDTVLKRHF